MLKTRVIPTLLWKDPGLVKGVAFDSWRRVGTVLPAIRVYNLRDVDEIIIVDITATGEQRRPDVESVRDFSQDCFVPLTVGGGIGSLEDIRELLRAGADKVSLNSALFERPELIASAAEHFGTQCIVASLDCRRLQGRTLCFSHSGTRNTEREVVEVARQAQQLGAGEILLTSIERDGTMEGYDLELVRQVAEAVDIPVIASGGAGKLEHFVEAVQAGASAVAAASLYHFTETTPDEVKRTLHSSGVPVRLGL